MILKHRNALLAAVILVCLSWHVSAQTNVEVGQRLKQAELVKVRKGTTHKLSDGRVLIEVSVAQSNNRVSSSVNAKNPGTMVVNERGVVGLSHNEVLISKVPTQVVRSKLNPLVGKAVSVEYFDHMDITSIRFSTLAQAITERNRLRSVFPDGQVSLPIQYDRPKNR